MPDPAKSNLPLGHPDAPLAMTWPHFAISRLGDVTRIRFHTEKLTGSTGDQAAQDLRLVATRLPFKTKMLVDGREVRAISSTVVAALVELHAALIDKSGQMRLVIKSEPVREVFVVTRLDQHLLIHSSADAAIDAFQRAQATGQTSPGRDR